MATRKKAEAVTQQPQGQAPRRAMTMTLYEDTADRLTVYCAKRRIPIGRAVEPWILAHLKGMRMPTMPDEADPESPERDTVPSGRSGEGPAESADPPARETLPIAGDVTPSPDDEGTSAAGAGEESGPPSDRTQRRRRGVS